MEDKRKKGKMIKEKRNILKTGLLGAQNKNLKVQTNSLLGTSFFTNKQEQQHRETKKTFLHAGKQPLFLVNLCFS